MSFIDKIPLSRITSYWCTICKKSHREGSKKFKEHYDQHFDKNKRYIAKVRD